MTRNRILIAHLLIFLVHILEEIEKYVYANSFVVCVESDDKSVASIRTPTIFHLIGRSYGPARPYMLSYG
jgi:hypothetical protein